MSEINASDQLQADAGAELNLRDRLANGGLDYFRPDQRPTNSPITGEPQEPQYSMAAALSGNAQPTQPTSPKDVAHATIAAGAESGLSGQPMGWAKNVLSGALAAVGGVSHAVMSGSAAMGNKGAQEVLQQEQQNKQFQQKQAAEQKQRDFENQLKSREADRADLDAKTRNGYTTALMLGAEGNERRAQDLAELNKQLKSSEVQEKLLGVDKLVQERETLNNQFLSIVKSHSDLDFGQYPALKSISDASPEQQQALLKHEIMPVDDGTGAIHLIPSDAVGGLKLKNPETLTVGTDANGKPKTMNIAAGTSIGQVHEAYNSGVAQNQAEVTQALKVAESHAKIATEQSTQAKNYADAAEARAKAAGEGEKSVFAYNSQNKRLELTTMAEAKANPTLWQNPMAVKEGDRDTVNSIVGGFNDVQQKMDRLHSATLNMDKVQGPTAAVLLKEGFGLTLGAFGTHVDLSNVNTAAYEEQLARANQATRDYVVAMANAHEAVTQLPRLQTFGKSNRMTQQQMEAAQKLLPSPGDDQKMATQKMNALQDILEPLRKRVPYVPGAELDPTWRETQAKDAANSGATHVYDPASGTAQPVQKSLMQRVLSPLNFGSPQ